MQKRISNYVADANNLFFLLKISQNINIYLFFSKLALSILKLIQS